MTKLNDQQRQVQCFIQREMKRTGEPPRLIDIVQHCDTVNSKPVAHRVVLQLVRLGYLSKVENPQRLDLTILKALPDNYDPYGDAAKAACEAAGVGEDKIPLVREAIAQSLTRAA